MVACSDSGTSQLNPGTPVATVTIRLGQDNVSPIPTLSNYYCGGWATDTSLAYNPTSFVSVFAKFTHIVTVGNISNPEGVGGAQAAATINWPDGSPETFTTTTTSDGLAVFQIPIKANATDINKVITINITFTIPGETCTIQRAAFFTIILVSPTPTHTAVPSPTVTPSVTPTGSPIPGGTPTGTPSPNPTKGN